MATINDVEMMKNGARLVQEALAAQGIEVKHSLMLEALSKGFGRRNWRTVREKLNGPSATPLTTLDDLGDGLRWTVLAVYRDNAQRYSDNFPGGTALEAQVIAQVDRLFDEHGAEIDVTGVIDRLTGKVADEESYVAGSKIEDHSVMLRKMAELARNLLGEPPKRGIEEAEAWDAKNVAIELFEDLLGDAKARNSTQEQFCLSVDHLSKHTRWKDDFSTGAIFDWSDYRGVEFEGFSATAALQTMLNLVEGIGIDGFSTETKATIYHAGALLEYGGDELDYVFSEEGNAFTGAA